MEKIKLYWHVFSPSILSFILLLFIKEDLLLPLIFSLLIGINAWNKFKFNKLLGFLSVIFFSYFTMFLGFIVYPYIKSGLICISNNIYFIDWKAAEIAYAMVICVLVPFLLFYGYSFIFLMPNSIIKKLLIFIAVIFLIIIYILPTTNILDITFNLWLFIMALSIQLIIYQENIFLNKINQEK